MTAHPAPAAVGTTVAEFAVNRPRTLPAGATVRDVHALFLDDHIHMALLTRDGRLLGCVERSDLDGADPLAPALSVASTAGRTIAPEQPVAVACEHFERTGGRRLAVVADGDRLVGLLCLKRSRTGFCSDRDVADRAEDRAQ